MPGPLHQFDHVWEEIFPVGSIHFESEDVHCIPLIEKHHNQRLSPFGESRAKSPIGKQVYGLLSEFSSSSIVVRTSLPEGHETSSITVGYTHRATILKVVRHLWPTQVASLSAKVLHVAHLL
eukprot:gb/GECG01000733.1/.p1 GENE.gb/GECG01000733.1/~~gb/GECG01000733.1/.p1  ORF type:complete len:122 (+),score=5.86 gb/GECG01000733.1/:1-366(+)